MLCYLRFPGRILQKGMQPPAALCAFVAEQLGLDAAYFGVAYCGKGLYTSCIHGGFWGGDNPGGQAERFARCLRTPLWSGSQNTRITMRRS